MKKVLIMGRGGTGKTSIRKVIFEGANPTELIENSLPPTMGYTQERYPWLDLEIVLFDIPGQSLEKILLSEDEYYKFFVKSTAIIYVIDSNALLHDRDAVLKELNILLDINSSREFNAFVRLFIHKVDLIDSSNQDFYSTIEAAKKQIHAPIPIHLTSIKPQFLHSLHLAFYELLSEMSSEATRIKATLDKNLVGLKKTTCYVTGENNTILSLSATPDFDFKVITPIHKLFSSISDKISGMLEDDSLDNLSISSKKKVKIIVMKLENVLYKMRRIVLISSDLIGIKIHKLSLNLMIDLQKTYSEMKRAC
ncbi:MAG: ADP-ribosylation factor-like protein [Promethearchaeota archaeon]